VPSNSVRRSYFAPTPLHCTELVTSIDADMNRRDKWRKVLDAELERWSAMSLQQLIVELAEPQAFEIEFESAKYQVEVELLENTEKYTHVAVSVDDGTLPASICPLTRSLIREKKPPAT
jgi:hypothetical protein